MGIIDSKIALVTDINVGGGEGTSKMIADAGGDSMPAIPLMRPMAVVSHNCLVTVRLNALENGGPGASALS